MPPTPRPEPTLLILGAGTLGTSTAHHLSLSYRDASKITLLDRCPSPSETAAAIDVNRIVRTDYARKLYCDLANEALHAWTWDLELQRFFRRVGWLVLGDGEGGDGGADGEGEGADGEGSEVARVRRVLRERGFDCSEDVAVRDVGVRWEGLRGSEVGGFGGAYFNSEAGWVHARSATGRLGEVLVERGVRRVVGEVRELLWSKEKGCVEGVVLGDGRRLTADKVVLAAGAWTSKLLSPIEDALGVAEEDRVESQARATAVVSAYYRLGAEEACFLAQPKNLPIVVYGKQGEVIPPSKEQTLLKYNLSGFMVVNSEATESGHRISVPTTPERSQYDVPAKLKKEMQRALTSKLLPEYVRGKQPEHWRICWDSYSPTQDLLMCKHPRKELGNLFLAAGGSFSGYKFLPNAGKYMVNVINGVSNGEEKDRAFGWKSKAEIDDAARTSVDFHEWRDLVDDRGGASKL